MFGKGGWNSLQLPGLEENEESSPEELQAQDKGCIVAWEGPELKGHGESKVGGVA